MGFVVKLGVTVVLAAVALGVWDVLFNFEINRCQMTYMFEHPVYIPIPLNKATQDQYPKYGLYVYGEGARVEQYHRQIFAGIPLLFLPGNAGSYRQARSLGSVLLRMAEKQHNRHTFDVFTIDFNEELAGLYGEFLPEQTDFAVRCSHRILQLYEGRQTRIVLVGHSVGGIIARAMFVSPSFNVSMADTVFTLSTPHRPVVAADEQLQEFYEGINEYWVRSIDQSLSDVVLLSLAGGHRDVLIRSERSALTGLFHNHPRVLSMTTTSVPAVWASTDHLCIVWCKQLVIAQARALFEMVDSATGQISSSTKRRMAVVRKHFTNPSTKVLEVRNDSAKQIAPLQAPTGSQLDVEIRKFDKPYWQLYDTDSTQPVVIQSSYWNNQWIRLCHDTPCDSSSILPIRPTRIPWFSDDPHFFAILPPATLTPYGRIALEVPRMGDDHYIRVDKVRSPPTINFTTCLAGLGFQLKRQTYQRYSVDLREVWEAVVVRVRSKASCRGLLRFTVPGFVQDTYRLIDGEDVSFPLKLQSRTDGPGMLEVFVSPTCTYDVRFSVAWLDVLGQIVRFYIVKLPVFFAAVIMLKTVGLYRNGKVRMWDHLAVNMLAVAILVARRTVESWAEGARGLTGMEGSSGMSGIELWLGFYGISCCLVDVMETVIRLAVTLYSVPLYWLAHPTIARLQSFGQRHTGFLSRHLVFPVFVALTSGVAYVTCGENGIILAVILYFLRVCYDKRHMACQSTTSVAGSLHSDVQEETQIILLAVLTALVNVVASLVWSKRLSGTSLWRTATSSQLETDPSFTVAILLGSMLDLFSARRSDTPVAPSPHRFVQLLRGCSDGCMVVVVYVCSALALALAQDYLYMLDWLLSGLLGAVSLHCLLRLLLTHN